MRGLNGDNLDPAEVISVPEGDCVLLHTPCHGAEVFVPIAQAVLGATLSAVCLRDGRELILELVADEGAASGLRAVWTEADPGSTPGTGTDLEGDG